LTIHADTNDPRTGRDVRRLSVVAPSTNGAHRAASSESAPALSIVVPTRNEAGNIPALVRRIRAVPVGGPTEIIFVDDSDDDTPTAIRQLPEDQASSVVLLHRRPHERVGGLGGAVTAGLGMARARWVCVLDADLQHPPERIEEMVRRASEENADLVIASRYCAEGDGRRIGKLRLFLSRGSAMVARLAFPSRLKAVTDPMSGFFMVRREAIDPAALRPKGFKILLEILVRTPSLRVAEVPFEFAERYAGNSKASPREALRYLALVASLRFGEGSKRMSRFMVVGLTGIAVNTIALAAFTELAGIHYLWSAVLATQVSTTWNFSWTEAWVFKDREHGRGAAFRLGSFWLMNNLALWVRGPALVLLTSGLGIHYVVSNLLTLGGLVLARYVFADAWIWRAASPRGGVSAAHAYDIHGIVSVESDAALPELAKFRVPHLQGPPTIRVRVGKVTVENSVADGVNLNRTVYDEGLGPFGFGMSIELGETTEVAATSLLRLSPHVLYTNVVEPILRWRFVEEGYALVHGACVSVDGRAFIITARTDTGKTTTMLKVLDSHPWSFQSDDLTLISPDGQILMYPKPMTISRHTVHAVRTPLLTWWERFTLIFQSRLHSRSGRIFAMFIAKTHLPVATVNTIVQMLVPPPKYHVEKLIPGVRVDPEATLAGLVIIQRGGTGDAVLEQTEALDILLANCEDAYGFPPYNTIEHFLHSSNGSDLRARERQIIAGAFANKPATLLRSTTMDWAERLPRVIHAVTGRHGLSEAGEHTNGRAPHRTTHPEATASMALPLESTPE
jgi:dolichol-phosphate mannosyltransferase